MAQTKQSQIPFSIQCVNRSILMRFSAFNRNLLKSYKNIYIKCKLYFNEVVQHCYGYAPCSWSVMTLEHYSLLFFTDFLPVLAIHAVRDFLLLTFRINTCSEVLRNLLSSCHDTRPQTSVVKIRSLFFK